MMMIELGIVLIRFVSGQETTILSERREPEVFCRAKRRKKPRPIIGQVLGSGIGVRLAWMRLVSLDANGIVELAAPETAAVVPPVEADALS